MKYLVNHQVINSDYIAHVEYEPNRTGGSGESYESQCFITLTSTNPLVNDNGWPVTSVSEQIVLTDNEADRFWSEYISDAYTVISPKQPQVA